MVTVSPDGNRVFGLTYPPADPAPNATYPPVNQWALVAALTSDVQRGALGATDVSAAAFSPDGSRIALGDAVGRVALLDAAPGAPVRKPVSGLYSVVVSLGYGPKSRSFVTGAEDSSVSLWDGRNGDLVGTVSPSHDAWASARLLADGRTVLISDVRGRLYAWDIRPERWVEFGCGLAGRDITRAEWRAAFGNRVRQRVCPG